MGQKSRWTLPRVVHPAKYRRFVICVPDERFYIAAFEGLLIELTYSKNWQRDTALTAAVVSRVWQNVLANVTCEQECMTVIEEMEIQLSVCEQLRFHDGKLQGLCCGEWTDITGQGTLPPDGGTQPGEGTDQPEPGGCQTYHASMAASNKWYLPTIVNTGDILTVTNQKGAGNDGTVAPWECPGGETFFAGLCIGGTGGTSGGDPLNTVKHMRLIANVAGAWVDILAGPYTVPGGVSSGQVYFQVNDSTLSDNAGSYTFDAQICNNQAQNWTSELNFLTDSFSTILTGGLGTWSLGVGYQGVSNGFEPYVVQPEFTVTAFELLQFTMYYNCTSHGGSGDSGGLGLDNGSFVYFGGLTVLDTGSPAIKSFAGDRTGNTKVYPTVNSGAAGAQVALTKLVIQGKGPKPPEFP